MNYPALLIKLLTQRKIGNKSRAYVLELQEKRLRGLLKYAFAKSPFYKEYYSDHGLTARQLETVPLSALPPVDRKMFRENFNRIVTDKRISSEGITAFMEKEALSDKNYLNRYHIVHSSGSSGKPTYYVYDEIAWMHLFTSHFQAHRHDIKPGELRYFLKNRVRMLYLAATGGRFAGAVVARYAGKNPFFRVKLLDVNTPLPEWALLLKNFNPNIISGYPSAIKILCTLVKKQNIPLDVRRIVTAGEPVSQTTRQYIEDTLQCLLTNIYGASESLVMGFELPGTSCMQLRDDLNCFEIEKDCTYITPLYNYIQPLIRYRMSDILVKKETGNEMSVFTQVEKVLGREEEMMWFVNEEGNEDFLHPLIIDDLNIAGLLHYQFIQESRNQFIIRIVTEKQADPEFIEKRIRELMTPILAQKKLSNLVYEITRADSVFISPRTGKSNLVIKEPACCS